MHASECFFYLFAGCAYIFLLSACFSINYHNDISCNVKFRADTGSTLMLLPLQLFS